MIGRDVPTTPPFMELFCRSVGAKPVNFGVLTIHETSLMGIELVMLGDVRVSKLLTKASDLG